MRIHAIQTGAVQIKNSQIVGRGHGVARRMAPLFDENWSDWLPVYAFAIEHRDGVILVDSGSNAGLKNLPRWHPYFRYAVRFEIEREQEAGPQLRALGIAPRDIKTVVLTHMHIDHDGGLEDFTASGVLVSPGELKAASGFAGEIRGYLPKRWPRGFDPQPLALADEPYGPFPKSRRLTVDGAVIAIPTPGHTRDHLSVAVEDGGACVILAGDASYSEASLIADQVDGVSGDENITRATLTKLRALAASRPVIYLPTHDPESAMRLSRRKTIRETENAPPFREDAGQGRS
ncbi:MAG TPA: N-acyl homoserine lactonase family protein [Roseiarcus sp.]|jgi:glyoxylase-like metal-dependent hydrolase (beta-lactamase superfamily II)